MGFSRVAHRRYPSGRRRISQVSTAFGRPVCSFFWPDRLRLPAPGPGRQTPQARSHLPPAVTKRGRWLPTGRDMLIILTQCNSRNAGRAFPRPDKLGR